MLLNFDEAGAEWIVVAYLCRDENMLAVVKSGKSPHLVTATRMFSVSEDLILAEEKLNGKLNDPEVISANRRTLNLAAANLPRTMSMRQAGKKNNHAGNYKIGYKEFALVNELQENEAKRFIDLYTKQAYPGLRTWWSATDDKIRKTRTLTNCFGRKCYFMGQIGEDEFKKAYAFVPQSTVADACLQAMVLAMNDDSLAFRQADLLAQVHDSLLYQYPADDFASMARFAVKLGREYLRPTIDYGEPFRLETDLKVGLSWAGMKSVALTDDVDAVELALKSAYDDLQHVKAS